MTLPWLALGCHNLTGGGSYLRSARLVACALDHGIIRFDVAPLYGLGTAEATLGKALGARRHDPTIEIVSKFGLLPPRGGWAKALLREPWRLARALLPERALPVPPDYPLSNRPPTGDGFDPSSPSDAVKRSLRTIGVERLGLYLTHETVVPDRRAAVLDGLAELVQAGLISAAGFSGESQAVSAMIVADRNGGQGVGTVAQVALRDFPAIPAGMKQRGFNLARVARAILDQPDLRVSLLDGTERGELAVALAAALALAHRALPDTVLLVNASSADRLGTVLKPLADGALDGWALAHAARFEALAGWRGRSA